MSKVLDKSSSLEGVDRNDFSPLSEEDWEYLPKLLQLEFVPTRGNTEDLEDAFLNPLGAWRRSPPVHPPSALTASARTAGEERECSLAGGRAEPCRCRDDRPAEEDTMSKFLRRTTCALLVTTFLLPLTAPAFAAPAAERVSESPVSLVAELWRWVTTAFGAPPIESVWAPGEI